MKRKPNDLELAAMASLHHWHNNPRNFDRKEPAYIQLLRLSLQKRDYMPYQLSRRNLDFEILVANATKTAA